MTEHEEREEIFNTLKEYAEKFSAEYYCVIFTQPSRAPFDVGRFSHECKGEAGEKVKSLVEEEVLTTKSPKKK